MFFVILPVWYNSECRDRTASLCRGARERGWWQITSLGFSRTCCWMPCLSAKAQRTGVMKNDATGRIAPSRPTWCSVRKAKRRQRRVWLTPQVVIRITAHSSRQYVDIYIIACPHADEALQYTINNDEKEKLGSPANQLLIFSLV